MTNPLTEEQRHYLRLVGRSMKGQPWAPVSKTLWPWLVRMQAALPELIEIDAENQRIRPTDKGQTLIDYL